MADTFNPAQFERWIQGPQKKYFAGVAQLLDGIAETVDERMYAVAHCTHGRHVNYACDECDKEEVDA